MTFGFSPLTDKGKKHKANRMAVDLNHKSKNRTKAKAQPRLKGYKKKPKR